MSDVDVVLQTSLSLLIVQEVGLAGHRLIRVVIFTVNGKNEVFLWTCVNCQSTLTTPNLELTRLLVQWVVIKIHPAGDRDPNSVRE